MTGLQEKELVYHEEVTQPASREADHNEGAKNEPFVIAGAETQTKFALIQEEAVRAEDFEHSLSNWQAVRLYRKAVFWAFIASLSIIMEGYDTSCTGTYTALPVFQKFFGKYYPNIDEYQIPAQWQSALGVAGTLGNLVGIPMGGWLIEHYGYRRALIGNYILIVPFIAISAFSQNLPMLFAGGLLQGLPFGVFSTLACGYASEVCPLKLRGYLTGWINICWVLGILFGTGIANVIINVPSLWGFRIGYMTQWCWPIQLTIFMWIAPDAPWWLVRKGRLVEAEVAMKRLTSPTMHDQVPEIVSNMVRTYQLELDVSSGSRWRDCFTGVDLRRTEIACMAFMCQSLCGDPFAGGPIYFFEQAGMSDSMAFKLGLVNPVLMLIANFVAFYCMSRIGRRKLYCAGMFGCMLLLLVIGGIQKATETNPNAKWAIAAITFIWNVWRAITLGPECYSIVSESSSSRLRNKTIALARISYNLLGLAANFLEPWLINPSALNLKGYTAFVWAPIALVGWLWCYFRLPEFKDRSFYELDVLFERKVGSRKFQDTQVESFADNELREAKHLDQH